jgi:hypothetical protein
VYTTLAIALGIYGFTSPRVSCAAGRMRRAVATVASRYAFTIPALMGLLTGLSLCPPFIAAVAGATAQRTVLASLLFFFSFFLATSLYVTPFPLAGLLRRFNAVRITARLAAGVMGVYYLYRGLIMIYGGTRS